jgi:hypothetical protein
MAGAGLTPTVITRDKGGEHIGGRHIFIKSPDLAVCPTGINSSFFEVIMEQISKTSYARDTVRVWRPPHHNNGATTAGDMAIIIIIINTYRRRILHRQEGTFGVSFLCDTLHCLWTHLKDRWVLHMTMRGTRLSRETLKCFAEILQNYKKREPEDKILLDRPSVKPSLPLLLWETSLPTVNVEYLVMH